MVLTYNFQYFRHRTSRWTQCLCTDEWTGRYCDKRKPEVFSDVSKISSSDDETNAKDAIITPSNCSTFLMSFEIEDRIFNKVNILLISNN